MSSLLLNEYKICLELAYIETKDSQKTHDIGEFASLIYYYNVLPRV